MENNNLNLPENLTPTEPKRDWTREIFDWLDAIIVSVVAVVILFTFFFRVVGIKGPSMQETLHENEKVIITNMMYEPKNGDIVVVSRNYRNSETLNTEPIIKRVIATEFQEVDIDFNTGTVFVDGVVLDESAYLGSLTLNAYDIKFPVTVPEDHIFVLGDNRLHSQDSRHSEIGMVDERYVLGHAVFRVFPFDMFGGLK